MHTKLIKFLLLCVILPLCSCKNTSGGKQYNYINYKFGLERQGLVGDIQGQNIYEKTRLYSYPNYKSYKELFDYKRSYIDFHVKGDSYADFHCETSFRLYDLRGDLCLEYDFNSMLSKYDQKTSVVILDNERAKESLGTIYVYTVYWCRWQCDYDVTGNGDVIQLTFEFFHDEWNGMPSWWTSGDMSIG